MLIVILQCDCMPCSAFQAQNRPTYYAPNQMTQMRPNPRWQQGGRPQGEHEGATWTLEAQPGNLPPPSLKGHIYPWPTLGGHISVVG